MGFLRRFLTNQREKLSTFFRFLYSDYRDVAFDTLQSYRVRPLKSGLYTSLLAGSIYSYWTNPKEASYYSALTEACLDIANLHPEQRSQAATRDVLRLSGLKETQHLRHLDLIFFSIVWRADHHKRANNYEAVCKHLRPHPATWIDRIEDVGSWGRWHRLEKVMLNYDVNEEFLAKFRDDDLTAFQKARKAVKAALRTQYS